ncbi:adenine deaminase, partial [bacterium]|nr:adenine deaminase [bacterium]
VRDFQLNKTGETINVIEAIDGQLITERVQVRPKVIDDYLVSDTKRDILKIAVVNRYRDAPVAIGFIKGFGLREGAVSTSVAHDSHNIVAVGVSDEDICRAVNKVIENRGGLTVVCGDLCQTLPLPIAGLMSDKDGFEVARQYAKLDSLTKGLGSKLKSPFMTLSFMALLVIPKIKLSDKGLFDGERFEFIAKEVKG